MLRILCAVGLVFCLSSVALAGLVEKKVSTRNLFGAFGSAETLTEYYAPKWAAMQLVMLR